MKALFEVDVPVLDGTLVGIVPIVDAPKLLENIIARYELANASMREGANIPALMKAHPIVITLVPDDYEVQEQRKDGARKRFNTVIDDFNGLDDDGFYKPNNGGPVNL